MKKTLKIPHTIIQFLKIYITSVSLFTIFRIILFFTEFVRINKSVSILDIIISFIIGLRFDIVISGYILILPFFIMTIMSFIKYDFKVLKTILFYYIYILFSLSFLVCAVDIPYFNQFFSRLSVSVFEWLDSPKFVFSMIIEEPRYWLIAIPLILSGIVFYKILKKILIKPDIINDANIYSKIIFSLIALFLILLGIRGRLEEKSPILIGTAYFSNNAFLNQLGLNPNFTLMRSYLDSQKDEYKEIRLMDDETALHNVRNYFNISISDSNFPIQREILKDTSVKSKYNVVLIIMESMSAAKTGMDGNNENLTPFLDSISQKGICFENAYTAGIHTFNGIFSSLFSFPALFRQHPMKESAIEKYHGIFNTLSEKNYSTAYFTTHDGQFDNVEGFMKANDCETIIKKDDYPFDKIATTLGVPDDYMFEFSIPVLNKLEKKGKPFVAAFMTASDHGPYHIPDYFKPKSSEVKKQIVEYADYSLNKFINIASKQSWFKNTIFVFVADHGAPIDGLYDMSLDYNHSPLIFYSPAIIKDCRKLNCMAGQIDVFPTVMGMLGISYKNNTLGIDLLKEKRPYIYFNADDKYGVIDSSWFLIVRNDKTRSLYKYREKNTVNYAAEYSDIVEKMEIYAKSNLQTYQYILKNHKQ